MRIDEHDLKPYAEPVSVARLQEGSVYFSVNYLDHDMLVPIVQPVIYVGRNLEAGDSGQVYFQDADSYRNGVRFDSAGDVGQADFHTGSEMEANHFFEYESALDELARCALRRRKAEAGQ